MMDIPKEHWGVHETHCCPVHGCKYRDENCPVVLKQTEKHNDHCEMCEFDKSHPDVLDLLKAWAMTHITLPNSIKWVELSIMIDKLKNDPVAVSEQGRKEEWWK